LGEKYIGVWVFLTNQKMVILVDVLKFNFFLKIEGFLFVLKNVVGIQWTCQWSLIG
jgi:hypothetical protein